MTNKEHFKEEILEIACSGDIVAVDKETNKPCRCGKMEFCSSCALWKGNGDCAGTLSEWLNSEYVEPCPFEEGELVEVSDDKEYWYLEYFVKFENGEYNAKAVLSDLEGGNWKYCQKYGTLGGLVNNKQNEEAIEKQIAKKPLMRY